MTSHSSRCTTTPRLTVVICTYNRREILQECLDSLARQSASTDDYDVLVVDNNSTDGTWELGHRFAGTYPNFRIVHEPSQGLSHARNAGWRMAAAEWVAYVDDDAKAAPNFVSRALETIDCHGFDCFGGVYTPWYRYGKPKWYRDSWGSNEQGNPDQVGPLDPAFVSGGVMVIRCAPLAAVGGFSTRLGMSGSRVAYGEEVQLQVLLRRAGYTIGWDPQLRVEHLVARHKLSVVWFLRMAYALGRDRWASFGRRPSWLKLVGTSLETVPRLLLDVARSTCRLFARNYYVENWLIDVVRPVVWRWGAVREGVRILLRPTESPAPDEARNATAAADAHLRVDKAA